LKGGGFLDTQTTQELSGSQALRILRDKARSGSLGDFLRDWKWILFFSRGRWLRISLYTLLGMVSSALGLATGVAGKYLIDCIVSLDKSRLPLLAAAVVLATLLSLGLRTLTARFAASLGVTMQNDVQAHVFENLLHARWLALRRFPTGDLMSRFSGDLTTVSGCAVNWLPNVVIHLFTLLASLLVVLYYDPVMALIAFASTPVLIFVSRRLLRKQRHYNQKMRMVSSGMSAFEAETFRNIDTLKSFGVEEDICGRLGIWQADYRKIVLEHNDFTLRTNILLSLLGMAVQFLALGYCLWQLLSGKILFGTMVLFLQQRTTLSSAFSSLIGQIPTALAGSVAAERLRELTDLPKEPRHTPAKASGSCGLELNNVSAAYEDGRQVLKNVDMTAEQGQITALVGPSGQGKSTLIRLMLGLLPPESGSAVLVDETGTRFPLGADTRHIFAYVPQGNTVLASTIAENLRLVNHEATEEQMVQALKDACAWDFVSRLPQGIHSPVGEGGKGFSEGQAQRIAIARALVRKAPVLLLDEMTSALDTETERQVLKNLMNRGVTCIVATHRPAVLNLCHRVYRVSEDSLRLLTEAEIQALQQFET
jgi:ABC-type multidrug transport system fused ATPase/permease subunit